ncbi:Flp pilus assembly complex ATPase component TadA [Luteolibacter yonseiensis]|uniref:Flp pilus assembly complex ATPase component TadA n=1 Tax=Luteolibacter yonseiensis TaxID=1144680 RepID=A0A934R2C5_9BACT|nr:ATPase, T2SS/T4P/T4SS family [Luteolibacter yonseiensis]MBK1813994.1 Flp pilus assembly complex ATPase component TadA [Luteolibacter yonseiensis]
MNSALNQLIRDAFADQANDVFLLEDEAPRVRREGEVMLLHPGPIPRVTMEEFWKSCGVDHASNLEADLSWRVPGGGRLRVNLYHTLGRLAAVMRPIRNEIPPLVELGLPAELLQSWMERSQGLVLITGPTGAGKSTTVASSLDWVNHHFARHIVTLEDPIEYLFTNDLSLFSQREMRQDSKDFPTGLRSALRQSPDILFLGEIRDQETAVTALQAAATGHLVVSTLHSSSVIEALDRFSHLLKQGQHEAFHLLAGQLIGIMSQRLLPRKGGGLFPALEYMQNEAATRNWILENKLPELQDHLVKSTDPSNCSLLEYLVASVQQGYLEPEIARNACTRPQDFDRALRGISNRS